MPTVLKFRKDGIAWKKSNICKTDAATYIRLTPYRRRPKMSFLCVSQQKASTEDPVSVWPPVTVLSYARDVVFIASSASFDAELHNSEVSTPSVTQRSDGSLRGIYVSALITYTCRSAAAACSAAPRRAGAPYIPPNRRYKHRQQDADRWFTCIVSAGERLRLLWVTHLSVSSVNWQLITWQR